MILFSEEVKNAEQLKEKINNIEKIPENYKIAVIVFAFDQENRLILQRRGPKCKDERFKLEGIGGGVKTTDKDFRTALKREIQEEAGEKAKIEVEEFIVALGEKTLDLRDKIEKYWILLAYRGTLQEETLEIAEPEKNLGFERYTIDQVPKEELSKAAKEFYRIIKEKYS